MSKDFDGNFTQQEPLRAEAVSRAIEVMNSEAPVPSAIAGAVGRPILVETTRDLVIDGDDLAEKISFSGAKILMLSHMRGHIAGTDALGRLCIPRGVIIIEDCAHTMGTAWGQVKSGRHGRVAGFSTQIYKHMNSGEGGLITSDDPELMARATVLSGYYMLYGRHLAGRPERVRLQTPNCSGRIDNLRAAVLRPQLARLDENCARWNERYHAVSLELANVPDVRLPERPGRNASWRVPSSSIKPQFDFCPRQGSRRRNQVVRRIGAGLLYVEP
jgi:dTDP-4-amino-4,6-dideoxygalactose transaminase